MVYLFDAGRTEIISNDQNPKFTAQFTFTYIFEEVQSVRLEVYDADSGYKTNDASVMDLEKQDYQGEWSIVTVDMRLMNVKVVAEPLCGVFCEVSRR